jgi:hypothetical protein
MPAKGWVLQEADEVVATAHGSLQSYDRMVPVIVLPPGRTLHAPLTGPDQTAMPITRVSTVVARWLGVRPPSSLR